MTATFLGKYESGTPEWAAMRAGRVGASDIGTILGISPFESRLQLLHRKAGLLEDKPRTKSMERGDLLEPAVLAAMEARWGMEINHDLDGTWADSAAPRLSCTPDGVTTCGVLFEAKTTSDRSTEHGWEKAGTDKVPQHYLAQVIWCCGLLNLKEWRLTVLAGATNGRPDLAFAHYRGKADNSVFQRLKRAALTFLNDLDELTEGQAQ